MGAWAIERSFGGSLYDGCPLRRRMLEGEDGETTTYGTRAEAEAALGGRSDVTAERFERGEDGVICGGAWERRRVVKIKEGR